MEQRRLFELERSRALGKRWWPHALFAMTVVFSLYRFFELSGDNRALTHIHEKSADGLLNATQFYEVNEMLSTGELSTVGLFFDNEHRLDDHQHPFGQMFIFPPYQSLLHQLLAVVAIKSTPDAPFAAAFNAQLIFSFLANFWIVWLVLVRLRIPRFPAVFGALLPCLSAYVATSVLLGHVQNVAYWPLVLVVYNAARIFSESDFRGNRRETLVRSVHLGLSLFALVAITPQYTYFCALIIVAALPVLVAVVVVEQRTVLADILKAGLCAVLFGTMLILLFGFQSMSPTDWYDSLISFYRIREPGEILNFEIDVGKAIRDPSNALFFGRFILLAHLLIVPLAVARFRKRRQRTKAKCQPLSAGAWFAIFSALLAFGGVALADFAEWEPASRLLYRINISGRVYARAAPMVLAITTIGAMVLVAHGFRHLGRLRGTDTQRWSSFSRWLLARPTVGLLGFALVVLVVDTPMKSPLARATKLDKYVSAAHREIRSRNEPTVALAEQSRNRKIAFGAFGGPFGASAAGVRHGLSGYQLYCTDKRFLPTHIAHDGKYIVTDWSNPKCTKSLTTSPQICSKIQFEDDSFLFETCETMRFDHWRKPLVADSPENTERTLVAGQRYYPIVRLQVPAFLRRRWALLGAGYENDQMEVAYRWSARAAGSMPGPWVTNKARLFERPIFVHLEGETSHAWLMGPPLLYGSGLRKGKGVDVPFEGGYYTLEIRLANETTGASSLTTVPIKAVELKP